MSARRPDWDRLAAAYDWQLPLERGALQALLGLLEVGEDERVLDADTGTGALLRELTRRERRPRQAVGLDSSGRCSRGRHRCRPGGSSSEETRSACR